MPRVRLRTLQRVVFAAALLPAAGLVWGAAAGRLGANPIDTITDTTGTWTLRFLVLTLAVTPVRRLTGWHEVVRLRRMLGLFAFTYASLHLATWVVLDQFFAIGYMLEDVAKRPYITVGLAAFLLMVPLAVTSTTAWIRRLGRRWQQLHRLVYACAALGVLHYLWLVKGENPRPVRYAAALGVLLGLRGWFWLRARLRASRRVVAAQADY
jgi:sulfoxide reductase heme-binding subunit YedZ